MDRFREFLQGANSMDAHFYKQPIISNIPALMGLIDCWYINYFKCPSLAVVPYDSSLELLPRYLSQLLMESNGKSVDQQGNPVSMETSSIIWGGVGTNAQHAFMQLLHQGTQLVPVDFLVPVNSRTSDSAQHGQLIANCLAQAETLMTGTTDSQLPAWRRLPGNQPGTVIVYDQLSPQTLGMILALYEHRTFVQACVWGINPFDQWGVEQGKTIACRIQDRLEGKGDNSSNLHPATLALIEHFLKKHK
ncbi:MAG TPA: glucose-6-phosphate isomerase, partial [Gammaproteobacteria bacterium]|nr:glucose-6-phosphate isomerase [Gammaproteobacteria bacterium]